MRLAVLLFLPVLAAFGWQERVELPACEAVKCTGRRIEDSLGVLRFCVPRGIQVEERTGEHGDRHQTLTVKVKGEAYTLQFSSGQWYSGKDPRNGEAGWKITEWVRDGVLAVDYRLTMAERVKRYVMLKTPPGFAEYWNTPTEVAARWDGVLGSACVGKMAAGR